MSCRERLDPAHCCGFPTRFFAEAVIWQRSVCDVPPDTYSSGRSGISTFHILYPQRPAHHPSETLKLANRSRLTTPQPTIAPSKLPPSHNLPLPRSPQQYYLVHSQPTRHILCSFFLHRPTEPGHPYNHKTPHDAHLSCASNHVRLGRRRSHRSLCCLAFQLRTAHREPALGMPVCVHPYDSRMPGERLQHLKSL